MAGTSFRALSARALRQCREVRRLGWLSRRRVDSSRGRACRPWPWPVVLWRMLYETAARAQEILCLDVPDLDTEFRRARVTSKGGAIDYVHWETATALDPHHQGWTLHQLRHSSLQHLAAAGRSAPELQAKSRHQHQASLGVYVRLGTETAARITAENDPANRRKQ